MKHRALFELIAFLLIMSVLLYIGVSASLWSIHNPKANQMTFWTHLPEALTFQRLPQFQEHP